MSAQQVAAPTRGLRALLIVALLLLALAVGAVTAVRLFPATASVSAPAADATQSLIQFRASERVSQAQGADATQSLIQFRASERVSGAPVAGEATSLNEFRAGERASGAQAANATKFGPPGR
jgi:hypothetical protein